MTTTISRSLLNERISFERAARLRGLALTLAYAGPWTRDPATANVATAPLPTGVAASLTVPGLLGMNGPASVWLSEKQKKWGQTFDPDGLALFPQRFPLQYLSGITDLRSNQGYDIAAVPPETFVETVCRAVYVRQGAIFPKRIAATVNDDETDAVYSLFNGLPCRITPIHGALGGGMEGDAPAEVSTLMSFLEYPLITEGNGVLGAGVFSGYQAGQGVFLRPGNMIMDDPSTYGGSGQKMTYRVVSYNLDPGGDAHHARHMISLQT